MILSVPQAVSGMHIMEGFLPPVWCISWGAAAIPFLVAGYFSIQRKINRNAKLKMLFAMTGAYTFVLSALKIPSLTGSSSHPTGTGLGAILFGPAAMSIIGLIVLLFQALLLAHGGLTTLGANTFSMAVAGPVAAYGVYSLIIKLKGPRWLAVFLGAALGDMVTYITASIQLAMAFPDKTGGFPASLVKFLGIYAITQIPLAMIEGILTVLIFNAIQAHSSEELKDLGV
jgi:cobalt/nickel transport system permease protein